MCCCFEFRLYSAIISQYIVLTLLISHIIFLQEQGIADDRPAFLLFVLFISGVAWRAVSARMRQSQQQRLSRLTHHVK